MYTLSPKDIKLLLKFIDDWEQWCHSGLITDQDETDLINLQGILKAIDKTREVNNSVNT